MKLTTHLLSVLVLLSMAMYTYTIQVIVTVTCTTCFSPFNCIKVSISNGYQYTSVVKCDLNYKKVYNVTDCESTRQCVGGLCYLEDSRCSKQTTCSDSDTFTNYNCGTCKYIKSVCSKSCWYLNTEIDQSCTDSCSKISTYREILRTCPDKKDSSGNTCNCCRTYNVIDPALVGTCTSLQPDLADPRFLLWLKQGLGSPNLFILPVLLILILLFNL